MSHYPQGPSSQFPDAVPPEQRSGPDWPMVRLGALAPLRQARAHPKVAGVIGVALAIAAWGTATTPTMWVYVLGGLVTSFLGAAHLELRRISPRSNTLWAYVGALVTVVPGVGVCLAAGSVIVYVGAVAAAAGVAYLWWLSQRSGGNGTVVRGKNSHVNADGTPKRTYKTEADALVAAREVTAKKGEAMSAYRCGGGCNGFHIGHAR